MIVYRHGQISRDPQVFHALLATVRDDLKRHLRTLAQVAEARLLDGEI
jgi:hypothetical protein